MTVKVILRPHGNGYRATCEKLGLAAEARTKEEASLAINTMIKAHVDGLRAEGKLPPEPPARKKPVTLPVHRSGGCTGCRKPSS